MFVEEINLDIVRGCQLKCIGCAWSVNSEKVKFMTADNFKKIIKNINVSQTKRFRFFNCSEPLLHPNLPEMVSMVSLFGFKCEQIEISTNAQTYNEETMKSVLKGKVLTQLYVSCDGDGSPESYEHYRQGAKWDKLIRFLTEARSLRDKYHPKMHLGTRTICPDEAGRKRWMKVLSPLGWTPEFRTMAFGAQSKMSSENTYSIPKGICKLANPKHHHAPRLYIDYDGSLIPCCRNPNSFVLGNLLENNYREIISSDKYLGFLRQLTEDRGSLEICNKCDQR